MRGKHSVRPDFLVASLVAAGLKNNDLTHTKNECTSRQRALLKLLPTSVLEFIRTPDSSLAGAMRDLYFFLLHFFKAHIWFLGPQLIQPGLRYQECKSEKPAEAEEKDEGNKKESLVPKYHA